jgi:hypothetical protein
MSKYLEELLYTIIITETNRGKYYIEKDRGFKNRRKLNEDEFNELNLILQRTRTEQYEEVDYIKTFKTGTRVIHGKTKYLVQKASTEDKYLEREYAEVLENTYNGTVVYYHTQGVPTRVEYFDNNQIKKLWITVDAASKITQTFLQTNQNLTIRYIGALTREDSEATETFEEITEILKEEEEKLLRKRIIEDEDASQYVKEDDEMQEQPQTPGEEEESDDSEENNKEKKKNEVRRATSNTD